MKDEFLTPDEFLANFRAGRTKEIEGREVRGNVSLYGETIAIAVRALDVTFWGEVDFSECRFERSVDLSGCSFAKTVTFRNTHIGGTLDLSEVIVRTESSAMSKLLEDTRSIDLSGVRVENDLLLMDMAVQYGTSAEMAVHNGSLIAEGMRVKGRLDMTGLKTDGSVRLQGSHFEGDVLLASDLPMDALDHTALIGRDMQATNCRFDGNLTIVGGQIQGDLNLWASTIQGVLFFRPSTRYASHGDTEKTELFSYVGGDLNLATASVAYLEAEALHVGGALIAFASRFNQISLTFESCVEPCIFGGIQIAGCKVDNFVSLLGLHVTGSAARSTRGVGIYNTEIGGSLGFWSRMALLDSSGAARIEPDRGPETLRSLIHGDLQILGCQIGGELDLTNVTATGRVVLDDTSVVRDLTMRSVASATHELRRGGVTLSGPECRELLATRTRALSLTNLRCENEVDLTGLVLMSEEETDEPDLQVLDKPDEGFVAADGCEVKTTLRLFQPLPASLCRRDEVCPGNYAVIPGAIDLTGSVLGELVLSFQSFIPDPSKPLRPAHEVGLVLANARIGEFTLPNPVADNGYLRIPCPIDLRDVQVGQWNIFNARDVRRTGVSRRRAFESLTRVDDGFRRSTFLNIEAALRNRGHSGDADHIYRRMMREDAKVRNRDTLERMKAQPWLAPWEALRLFVRLSRETLFSAFLGYGTQPLRLLGLIVIFWLAALPAFLTPSNFEPSLEMLGTESGRFEDGGVLPADQPPRHWTWASGVAESLKYHIPVITLGIRDEWDLRETGRACYELWRLVDWAEDGSVPEATETAVDGEMAPSATSACNGWAMGPAPEDWGVLIALLNWIAWPFVLAFALNRFLRVDRTR